MESLGKRLTRLRKAKGLTQKEVARILGVASSTYREWEYGRDIKGNPYPRLSKALGVTLKELLTGESSTHPQIHALIESIETHIKELKSALESVL